MIVATGASARQLGLESEQACRDAASRYCATCDAAFFRDKACVVVGGGDSAMEEALYLSRFASKVSLVHRRDELRASQIMADRARCEREDRVRAQQGRRRGARRRKGHEGMRLRQHGDRRGADLDADGVFVAIGHDPNTALFLDQLDHEPDSGYLARAAASRPRRTSQACSRPATSRTTSYRQAVTAAGSGCAAALDAERWLSEQRHAALSAAAGS